MKFCSCYNFRKLFHICRFDIDDIEALILDVQIPEIDSQVVAADKGLAITVDRYAVDVVGVCIGVGPARYRSNDRVMVCQAWKFQ